MFHLMIDPPRTRRERRRAAEAVERRREDEAKALERLHQAPGASLHILVYVSLLYMLIIF